MRVSSYLFAGGGLKNFVVLPASVVDRHMRACSGAQLKALLYLLRNEDKPLPAEEICADLALTPAELEDAVQFWVKCGVLQKNANTLSLFVPKGAQDGLPRYAGETVLLRAQNDKDLSTLLAQAEQILNKVLTPADISTLFGMYDWLGLPVSVIAILLDYCHSTGNDSMRYMEKTAINWSDEGVRTAELAAQKVEALERARTLHARVAGALGIGGRNLTKKEREYIDVWTGTYGYGLDEILYAFEQSADNTGKLSFAYMDKVLSASHEKGYRTADQMRSAPRPVRKSAPAQKKLKNNSVSSIDDSELFKPFWEIIEKDS